MADTTRKKTASFDRTTVSKDQNKETGVETAKNPKPIVKSPKPPLPPRPPGLSKASPGKRNITLPKLSQNNKEKTPNANQDGHCSRPRRPPPPSTQTSKTLNDSEQGNNKELDNKTTEIVKAGTSENSLSTGNVSLSQDITEHDNVLPNIPQVEASSVSKQSIQESVPASTDTKHSEKICDVKSAQDKTEPNISQDKTEPNISVVPKPSRPKQPKTSIESSPESKLDSSEKTQNSSVAVSGTLNTDEATTKSEKSSTKTPERPKPPVRSPLTTTDNKLNTLNSDNKSCTAALKETPDIPKAHKVTPPVPPKPDSPRSAKKSKSSKLFDVVGKQSPPVQPRKPKPFAKPKVSEPASEIVKEKVAEKSGNFDVDISSEGETCSFKNTSTEVVVPSETHENCPTPQKSNVDKDGQESKNDAEVKTDLEKEIQEKTESSVAGSESLTRKEAKPSRPRLPSRKKEDAINELTCDNNSEHENNKVENTTSLKPSRPCPPIRKTEDEKILKSCEDLALLENIPATPCESVQSHQVVAQEMQHEHSKAEKVASPKPLRPRAPSRKIKDDKIIHDNLTLQEDLSNCPGDQGSCKPVTNEVEQKNNNTETTTSSKPSRPSKPTRPPPAATKDSESNLSHDEHESKLSKHQNDKPQRPMNPTLRTESMVVSDPTTDYEAQKNKPQKPSRPKLSSDADESEEDTQKNNPELNHTDARKEKTPANKHDTEVDSNHSVKRTGSVKPCRPPEPSSTKHEISSQETSSSCVHTVAGKSKPPRPQAPRHEKRITLDKQESVETSLKPREPNQEKGTNKTPPKPKRTSISDRNVLETQQSETDRDCEKTKIKQTPVHNAAENKDNLSKAIDNGLGETESSEVMENDNEDELVEVENILVANVKPEETNNISDEDTSEQLTSFDCAQTNSDAQKDEKISCIVAKQQEKKAPEETLEDKKCSDRHNVRFRVSSLSKTEVESFNRKEFLAKLKTKGYTGPNSEGNSAPQVRSKPARPCPPSTSKKNPGKDEYEDEVEELGHEALHGNDALQATEHKNQASTSEDENISEKSLSISDKRVDMVNQSESSDVSPINKVDNISEPVASSADKVHNSDSSGITGIDIKKCNDIVAEVAIKKKKIKRMAPPAPDEKQQDLDDKKMSEKQTRKDKKNVTKPDITTGEQQIENTADNLNEQRKSETVKDTEDSTQCSEHTQQLVEEERNNETVEQPALESGNTTGGCAEESNKDLNHISSALKNLSPAESDSIKTQEVSQKDSLNNDVGKDENVIKTEAIDAVQSPKKKKTPPPKPKRTSSLKRDSKLIVPKREANEEETSATTERDRISSPSALNEIIEENNAGKSSTAALDENTSQLKHPSSPVSRSKSFAFPGKGRTKETTAKDNQHPGGEERVSRSFSFSGKNKYKQQPTRPSPPTFFVTDLATDESTNSEKVSEEASNDDVIIAQDTSSSQEDLVELEVPRNDTKHDSVLTTDSESESEKEPQKSKTYYISREILTTERTFVDVIKLVSEDFREAVAKGNKKFGRTIIPDETLHDIMMNISQIYVLDSAFLKALEDRMETWEEEQRIGDIIKTFSPFLKMYKTYIQGYDNAMAILTESLKKYPQFAEVVREFECSERCRNLTVGMYMLKPIQRIPSYRLLLMDYLKHLSEDSLDYKDVSDALAIVSEVATHINEDMKRVDNFEEVLKVQRSLVGQVEIVKPGRALIKEGVLMKLSRKEMQPRMFYLFTDVLLYTTPVANNQFRLNLTLALEEIEVELPVSPDFENEFSIIGTKKSFTLSASTLEERDEWLEALRNASDEIRKKKITFHLAKKEKMEALYDAQQREDDKEAQLGSKAPVWIPDARVTMCMLCTDDFTVTNRRHHCRACGKVICGSCSSNSAALAYLNYETARVCDVCYDELTDKTASTQTVVKPSAKGGPSTEEGETPPKISATKKSRRHTRFFKSKEVPAVQESTISGYLKTRVGKKWQKRWYVVKDNVLYASKASSDPAAQETTPLLGYEIRGPEKMDGDSKKIVFQLIHRGTEPVVLQTDNMKHGEQWVNALRRATILPL